MRRSLGVVGSLALAAGAGLAWGLAEAHSFVLRRRTVPVLPAGSRPVRILHLSDLHLTPSQRDKVRWVRALAAEPLDAVITTGDNLAHLEAVPTVLEALEPLLRLPGAFVLGSNDYFGPHPKNPFTYFASPTRVRPEPVRLPTDDLRRGLTDAGWLDLDNARGVVQAAGSILDLVGLDDPHIGRDAMPEAAALAAGAATRIGVVHAPYTRALDRLAADGAELILAGHTHGGQVCVPLYGALVTNCDLDTSRASGLHGWPGVRPDSGGAGAFLHVSGGLGTSPYAPVRFACRPEATVLTLVPRS
ncbi:metallophosphoesterase family protein [Demequina sp. SYSU T00039]|uniref:Metallophosphoesterase family protein n=1 Tax=Demequina lignilytica TaxID=3051663 RepID=A0AAW7M389_9MICO|nr:MULTISPECIES: metallophosphoesterase [unclassified Demequina]MDN4477993.1 metallophosphoesterase family protein [Demequina sp. SYSU T00039-1]MDN4487902.1 metallophosphoesterase family protein [Demequina sp. SYSU T00039]